MTREEHLTWAKTRALAYAADNDLDNAMASMLSDLEKHEELTDHLAKTLFLQLRMNGQLQTQAEVIKFINGFN